MNNKSERGFCVDGMEVVAFGQSNKVAPNLTHEQLKRLRRIGNKGYVLDTDALDCADHVEYRNLIKAGWIFRSRMNNRQTILKLTAAGHAALTQ